MKGKIAVYFGAPNLGKLRARLEGAPKELTNDLREKYNEITVEVLNQANLTIRAKMIDFIASRTDLKFKTDAHKAQVMALPTAIFDTIFASNSATLNQLLGTPAEEAGDEDLKEEVAEEAQTAGEVAEEAQTAGEVAEEAQTAADAPADKRGKGKAKDDEFE